MRICIATPAPRRSRKGNRVTALRWAAHLRALGHAVRVVEAWRGEACDLLVALHATRSSASAETWRERRGAAPLVVSLAGTDLYDDLPRGDARTLRALALADAVTVLQPRGLDALPPGIRPKTRVILQSATPQPGTVRWSSGAPPRALVLAHLRPVKDPFLAAEAARLLPAASAIEVEHAGAALDGDAERRVRDETARGGRWRWLGELRHRDALRRLAGAWLLLVTSRLEGGANAVSEAIACGVPVLSTYVDGSLGMLGDEYPGYFPVGDARALADLLIRCERDPGFRDGLAAWCGRLAPRFAPAREREAWRGLLAEVAGSP